MFSSEPTLEVCYLGILSIAKTPSLGCLIIRFRIQSIDFFPAAPLHRRNAIEQLQRSLGKTCNQFPFKERSVTLFAAQELLVQFRVPESLFDMERLCLARKTYGNVVPACVNKGFLGSSPSP